MTFRNFWDKQMKTKTGLKYLLVQKVVKKQTNYLTDFRQAEILKCLLATVPGVPTLVCLEINMVLNGWWTLTQNITDKSNHKKQRMPDIGLAKAGLTNFWKKGLTIF